MQNLARPHLNKPGMVVHTYNLSYAKGIGMRIMWSGELQSEFTDKKKEHDPI
jgi:hypothetical protein